MPLGKRNLTDVLRRLGTAVAGLALAAGLVQCASESEPEPPKRPNILLIMVDATRADSLSCYGYPRQTTPFLDALAAEGVRFDRAYAASSWTVPSVASTLTSTYVNQHGLGKRFRGVDAVSSWAVIPGDVPNLAQLMTDGGYRTFGLVANMNLAAERGFGRGFERFECLGSVDADSVRQTLESWLPEIAGTEEPWFFWLFLFDPHGPYDGREPWLEEFDPQWRRAKHMNGFPPTKFSLRGKDLEDDEVAVARACYDSEIRAADDLIREVYESLPAAADAFVMVTADHGEEFMDHGGTLHGRSLYDESVRIPFIVRAPDGRSAGTVVNGPVSLVDVLPTILGAAGIETPVDAEGLDLMQPEGVHVPAGRQIFAELRAFRAVIDERWKLILTMGHPERDMLFDLEADPGESNNLAAAEADRIKAMKDLITAYERAGRVTPPESITIDRHTVEKLRGLGYIGGGGEPMAARTEMLLAELARALNRLPGVFSTPQWGGRAYKVPRGNSGKPKLLAHVTPVDDDQGVTVSFKLQPPAAADQVEHHDWIAPHSFRTLAPSGWVTATVRTKKQLATLKKLLVESHGLQHPKAASSAAADAVPPGAPDAVRINQVLRDAANDGWSPQSDW